MSQGSKLKPRFFDRGTEREVTRRCGERAAPNPKILIFGRESRESNIRGTVAVPSGTFQRLMGNEVSERGRDFRLSPAGSMRVTKGHYAFFKEDKTVKERGGAGNFQCRRGVGWGHFERFRLKP